MPRALFAVWFYLVWLATHVEQSLELQAVLISSCIKTVGIIIQSVYSFASLGGECGSDSLVVRTSLYGWRLEMYFFSTDWFGIPVC